MRGWCEPILVRESTYIGCFSDQYSSSRGPIQVGKESYIALLGFLYSFCEVIYIQFVAPRRDKSCGRVADKFGLRAWTINLRTWIFGFTCLVFKTTYIDRGKALREGAFPFTRTTLFPPLDKRNTHDKAKGLCVSSERHIGELGTRYLSTLNRVQDSRQQSHPQRSADEGLAVYAPSYAQVWGEVCWGEEISHLIRGMIIYNVRARIGGKIALSSYEFACLFGSLGDFSLPLHSQKKRTAQR